MERLVIAFEYDVIDVPPPQLQHILRQLQELLEPRPELVYAAVGDIADELHDTLHRQERHPDPRAGVDASRRTLSREPRHRRDRGDSNTPGGHMDTSQLTWRRSSRCSADQPQCVEVASDDSFVVIRDSKHATGPMLAYTRDEWTAFRDSVKAGEFDSI